MYVWDFYLHLLNITLFGSLELFTLKVTFIDSGVRKAHGLEIDSGSMLTSVFSKAPSLFTASLVTHGLPSQSSDKFIILFCECICEQRVSYENRTVERNSTSIRDLASSYAALIIIALAVALCDTRYGVDLTLSSINRVSFKHSHTISLVCHTPTWKNQSIFH